MLGQLIEESRRVHEEKMEVRAWKKMYRTYLNKTGGQENGKNDLSGQCSNN